MSQSARRQAQPRKADGKARGAGAAACVAESGDTCTAGGADCSDDGGSADCCEEAAACASPAAARSTSAACLPCPLDCDDDLPSAAALMATVRRAPPPSPPLTLPPPAAASLAALAPAPAGRDPWGAAAASSPLPLLLQLPPFAAAGAPSPFAPLPFALGPPLHCTTGLLGDIASRLAAAKAHAPAQGLGWLFAPPAAA